MPLRALPALPRPLVAKLVRYGAVSLVATTTSLVVLGVVVSTRTMAPGWANVVATAVGTVPSFELNRRWVWRQRGSASLAGQVVPFAVLSFAGLALSTLTVTATASLVDARGIGGVARTLLVQAANLAGFGSLWVLQFVLLDRWLFRSRGPAAVVPLDVDTARPEPVDSAAWPELVVEEGCGRTDSTTSSGGALQGAKIDPAHANSYRDRHHSWRPRPGNRGHRCTT